MICVPDVVGFVQSYQALNDTASHEANAGKIGLPANEGEPAWRMLEHYWKGRM